MFGRKKWTQWIYWFSLALATVLVYKTLDSFSVILNWISNAFNILMPFIIAILIAYIFYIPSRKIEGLYNKISFKLLKRKARFLSVISIYLLSSVIIIAIMKFVAPSISGSITDLLNNFPNYYNNATEYLNNLPETSIFNKIGIKSIFQNLQSLDLSQIIKIENISGVAIESVKGATSIIFNLFVAVIVSIYILLERKDILEFIKKFAGATFKSTTYKKLVNYCRKTNEIFYKFISSQVIDAVVIGTILSITLTFMKIKYGILLGFIIGLLNIIPYFGAIIGVIISFIITILTGGIGTAIFMTIIVVIIQQIDANIINPKIIGNSLKLSPILIIFAVTVCGAYFGVLGMFLAVPIVAILKILILDYISYRNFKTYRDLKNTKKKEIIRNNVN